MRKKKERKKKWVLNGTQSEKKKWYIMKNNKHRELMRLRWGLAGENLNQNSKKMNKPKLLNRNMFLKKISINKKNPEIFISPQQN